MRSPDTSLSIHATQIDAFRRMSATERVAAALEMSEAVRSLAEAGIRHRNPEFSDEEVRLALVEIMLGADLASRARAATDLR